MCAHLFVCVYVLIRTYYFLDESLSTGSSDELLIITGSVLHAALPGPLQPNNMMFRKAMDAMKGWHLPSSAKERAEPGEALVEVPTSATVNIVDSYTV